VELERNKKSYFIEFLDIGGSSKHKESRAVFYQQMNGSWDLLLREESTVSSVSLAVLLVHDCSNRKSYQNLWKWICEVRSSEFYREEPPLTSTASSFSSATPGYDFELKINERGPSIPAMIVGTKIDMTHDSWSGLSKDALAEEVDAEQAYVVMC
jgi:hypothetical protein